MRRLALSAIITILSLAGAAWAADGDMEIQLGSDDADKEDAGDDSSADGSDSAGDEDESGGRSKSSGGGCFISSVI